MDLKESSQKFGKGIFLNKLMNLLKVLEFNKKKKRKKIKKWIRNNKNKIENETYFF